MKKQLKVAEDNAAKAQKERSEVEGREGCLDEQTLSTFNKELRLKRFFVFWFSEGIYFFTKLVLPFLFSCFCSKQNLL